MKHETTQSIHINKAEIDMLNKVNRKRATALIDLAWQNPAIHVDATDKGTSLIFHDLELAKHFAKTFNHETSRYLEIEDDHGYYVSLKNENGTVRTVWVPHNTKAAK